MKPVRLALLWHMHQPLYRHPASGEYILPWVRLHATRAYNDMAWILEKNPRIRCTVNFVPALLEQLEDYVAGRARDRFLDLTLRPPADLSAEDRQFLLRNFFMVDWDRHIRPVLRYQELLDRRGRDLRQADLARVARSYSEADFQDLQAHFNLAWLGFGALADDPTLAALVKKGRGYTREDIAALVEGQRKVMAGIVPRWKALADAGQVELSATPAYHPILPLVCDTDSAARAMPEVKLPPRFAHPEDARWQVQEAVASHTRRFGKAPLGMWPAEGSVSPEALAVLAAEGVRWAASDEGVLFKSLPAGAPRAESLYRPWRVTAGNGEIAMLFRDRNLSDLIGFTYAKNRADDAATDFLGHLSRIGAATEGATVGVFLDGENAWEHYPHSGHDFLAALYKALSASPNVETVTLAEATREAAGTPIEKIHSGSWIDANYRIWIGHAEDRAGWTALGKARKLVERAAVDADRKAEAMRHLYAAEGSDWFWWYGDDFVTESAAEFDALFRAHLVAACEKAGVDPPPDALKPLKSLAPPPAGGVARTIEVPRALISPRIDGRDSYFDWLSAGLYHPEAQGSMHGGEQAFASLRYGFDLENLYLRLDPARSPDETCVAATHVEVRVETADREVWVRFPVRRHEPATGWQGRGWRVLGRSAFVNIMELELPFRELAILAGTRFELSLRVLRGDVEVERLPRFGHLVVDAPGADFERIHWRV